MELEINLSKNDQAYWAASVAAVVLLVFFLLGWIGSGVTNVDAEGNPQILSWSGWQLIKAEKLHSQELAVLQGDATQLAALLENRPNPVAAQFALDAVQNHVKNGTDPSLAGARQALDAAATNVRDWASGALDQNTAIQSLKDATELLR